jgi:hypothetical protein
MLSSPWYALTVKPRHERSAAQYLREKGFEEFSPIYPAIRRWLVRVAALPGFVPMPFHG